MITFTVPGQPQGKGRARIVKIGGFARMATPKETVAYEGLIAHAARLSMDDSGVLLDGPCSVVMDIVCMVPGSWSQKKQAQALRGEIRPTTKPDIDNVEKAIFDGCNAVVWRDDVQVVEVRKAKRYGEVPGVTVRIEQLDLVVRSAPAATEQLELA